MENTAVFSFDEADGKLVIHLNPSADRNLLPSVLEDPAIDNLPFNGKKTVLEGGAPLWLYAYFAVRAVMKGTKEIIVCQAGMDDMLVWSGRPLLTANAVTDTPCFVISQKDSNAVRLKFKRPPYEKGDKWTMADLIKTPLNLPDNTEILFIGGRAAIWMYTAVAVTAHNAGIKHILCDLPIERAYISIGAVKPNIDLNKPKLKKNGLVIGIVGNPNSGKSVFSDWLENEIMDEWQDSWRIDADHASPTPKWYLDGVSSGQEDEVIKIRKKQDWTSDMELNIAERLRTIREYLDITLVDLPGGKKTDTGHICIPQGREVIFKEIDLFLILWRDEAIRENWLSALREHNMETRVFAEIQSCNPDDPPFLETHREENKVIGKAQGLKRGNSGYSVRQIVKQGAQEIIKYLLEIYNADR